jgi:tight adherence protein B
VSAMWIIKVLGSVLAAFGASYAVTALVSAASGPVVDAFHKYRRDLDWDLRFIRHPLTATQVIALQGAGTAVLFGIGAGLGKWLALTALPVVWFTPRGLLQRSRLNRITAIDAQVDTWLVILANALRATPSLGEAIESSSKLVPAPLSQELDLALNEYHLGAPLDVALKTMSGRLKSRTMNVALGTLRIARNTGGNLPETLEISAAALREIARLEGVVRTKTAEGKAQAVVIAIIPFPLVGLLNAINPALLAPLWTTFTGYTVVAGASGLWLIAIMWTRKILNVDI